MKEKSAHLSLVIDDITTYTEIPTEFTTNYQNSLVNLARFWKQCQNTHLPYSRNKQKRNEMENNIYNKIKSKY